MLFYTIEALTGRAVPERIQGWGYQMGLIMVMSLMAFALYNDFSRLEISGCLVGLLVALSRRSIRSVWSLMAFRRNGFVGESIF